MPLISAVIVTYNCERYLPLAVESVLRQQNADLELIVVDNASTDGTRKYLESVRDPRLVTIFSTRNGGPQAANLALPKLRGKYIARLDADDIALPGRLALQAQHLEARPAAALCGSLYEEIDEDGIVGNRSVAFYQPSVIRWQLGWQNFIGHSTIMMRRDVFEELGGYRDDLWCVQDYDLISRTALRHEILMLPECLVQYRVYANSITTTRKEEMLRTSLEVSQRHLAACLGQSLASATALAATRIMRQLPCPADTDWSSALALIESYGAHHCRRSSSEEGGLIREETAKQLLRFVREHCRGKRGVRLAFELSMWRLSPRQLAKRLRGVLRWNTRGGR